MTSARLKQLCLRKFKPQLQSRNPIPHLVSLQSHYLPLGNHLHHQPSASPLLANYQSPVRLLVSHPSISRLHLESHQYLDNQPQALGRPHQPLENPHLLLLLSASRQPRVSLAINHRVLLPSVHRSTTAPTRKLARSKIPSVSHQ